MDQQQLEKIRIGNGFIAALDQSGGSTPGALAQYGIEKDAYSSDEQMLELMHAMRTRIATSPAFNGDRVIGAILFEDTIGREVEGRSATSYLWGVKQIVPFLKVDKGLTEENQGVQLMRPIPELDKLLARGRDAGVFGTKMRSVIKLGDPAGVPAIIDQQFEVGAEILAAGLMPILEPEIDIKSPQKAAAEGLLRDSILGHLDQLPDGQQVMVKLSLPNEANFYADLVSHPKVLKVVALSGGYDRDEAVALLRQNNGVIASFSRALTEGLWVTQSEAEFNATLEHTIEAIYEASIT